MEKLNENKAVEKLRKQTVKSIMDIIVLTELQNSSMSGYDVMGYIHNKFGVLLSSGTIYGHLYTLERDGLIRGIDDKKKRIYKLTQKGRQTLKEVSDENQKILDTLKVALTA